MKYVLFIAMDLAVYPFLLLFYIAKCIFDRIQPITLTHYKDGRKQVLNNR